MLIKISPDCMILPAFVEENGPDVQRSSSMRSTEGDEASGGQVIHPLKGQYQKKGLECFQKVGR